MRVCLLAAIAAAVALASAGAARAQNMIPDPSFKEGVSAWTPVSIVGDYSMTFVPGFSKRPGSGSAQLSYDAPAGGRFSICVNVVGGRTYDWGFSIYFPDATRTIGLNDFAALYSGPACSGSNIGGRVLPIVPAPGTTGVWLGGPSPLPLPANCQSVEVGIAAVGVVPTRPLAYFDDAFFAPAGTVPLIDSPESAPTLSTLGLLVLAGSLALAASRLLR